MYISLAIFLLTCIVGCAWLQSDVAKVGDTSISVADFRRELIRTGADRKASRLVLDNLINDQLLLTAAIKAKIPISEAEIEHVLAKEIRGYDRRNLRHELHAHLMSPDLYRQKVKNRILIEKFITEYLHKLPAVTDAQLMIEVDKQPARMLPRRVYVKQSLFASLQEATEGREKPLREDLGWLTPGQWPKAFDPCFDLAKGTLSEPIESEYGFHIFQIVDEEAAHEESVAELKMRIKIQLEDKSRQNAIEALLKRLAKRQGVRVNESALRRAL